MNFAHLHLIVNHVPIIGIPVALSFLAYGLVTKNLPTQRFSLFILLALSLMVLPVYLTGEPAEEVVEHLPGVVDSLIEPHEDAGKISLIFTLLTGVASFVALWFQKNEAKRRLINLSVMGVACIALMSLIYTANLGGKVRHTEFRAEGSVQTESDHSSD